MNRMVIQTLLFLFLRPFVDCVLNNITQNANIFDNGLNLKENVNSIIALQQKLKDEQNIGQINSFRQYIKQYEDSRIKVYKDAAEEKLSAFGTNANSKFEERGQNIASLEPKRYYPPKGRLDKMHYSGFGSKDAKEVEETHKWRNIGIVAAIICLFMVIMAIICYIRGCFPTGRWKPTTPSENPIGQSDV